MIACLTVKKDIPTSSPTSHKELLSAVINVRIFLFYFL